jgi:hypothetical protein
MQASIDSSSPLLSGPLMRLWPPIARGRTPATSSGRSCAL